MIIALAGRRVDAADAKEPRFPLRNVELVRARARQMFEESRATVLVSSAACGGDLIALTEAGRLGVRRRVVLPFSRDHFRETSVVDRPGDWGPVYDQVMDEVESAGDLMVLNCGTGHEAYLAATRAILAENLRLGEELHQPTGAALVWDGASRGSDDLTAKLGDEARQRGLPVFEVKTL